MSFPHPTKACAAAWYRPPPLRSLAARFIRSHSLWRLLREHGSLLAAVVLGATATSLTSTLPSMAIPLLSAEFHLGQDQAQWTNTAYLQAMAGGMLAMPWLVQRMGLHLAFAAAIGLLLGGAALCGMAGGFDALVAGRLVQGLATGVLQPMPALVVVRHCREKQYGRVTGLLALLPTLAVAFGPGAAGLLMASFGWRAVFWLSWPLCLGALLLMRVAHRGTPQQMPAPGGMPQSLDWPGLLLVNLAMAALLLGMVQLRAHASGVAAVMLSGAVAAAVCFVARQQRLSKRSHRGAPPPLLELSLLLHGNFGWGCMAAFMYGSLLYGSTYLLPLLMQRCLGLGVAQVGTTLLIAGLAMVVGMPLAGRQLDRRPHLSLVSIGFALLALSLAGLPWLGAWGWLPLTAGAALGRLGLGVALAALYVMALRGLPRALGAQGASLSSFLQAVGGALGAGLSGVFMDWRLGMHAEAGSALAEQTYRTCHAADDTLWLLALMGTVACLLALQLRTEATRRPACEG